MTSIKKGMETASYDAVAAPRRRPNYSLDRLRYFILGTAVLHLGGFITVLAFGKDQKVPLSRSYVMWPHGAGGSANATNTFTFGSVHTSHVSMATLVGAFFLLSFAFQFVPAAMPLLWRNLSTRLTTQAIQPFRFVEYSFSASCLFLVALLIDGVMDLYHVVLAFAAMWTVMMFGLLQELTAWYLRRLEQLGGPRRNMLEFFMPHAIGWVLYIVLWAEAIDRFSLDMDNIKPNKPPQWVVSFYYFLFAAFTSFGANQAVEMVRLFRTAADDAKALANIAIVHEYVYTLLSLLAKSVSGYFLLNGMLASSSAAHY